MKEVCQGNDFSYNTYIAEARYQLSSSSYETKVIYAGHYKCCAVNAAKEYLKNHYSNHYNKNVVIETWQSGKPLESYVLIESDL